MAALQTSARSVELPWPLCFEARCLLWALKGSRRLAMVTYVAAKVRSEREILQHSPAMFKGRREMAEGSLKPAKRFPVAKL